MDEFYCLALFSQGKSRYFKTLRAAQEACLLEDVRPFDCIFLMQLIGDEYEPVEEYGIECLE